MAEDVHVKVYKDNRLVFTTRLDAELALGRQRAGEPEPYQRVGNRLILAAQRDVKIARNLVSLVRVNDDEVKISNISGSSKLLIHPESPPTTAAATHSTRSQLLLEPGATADVLVPAMLLVADRVVRIEAQVAEELNLASLAAPTLAPSLSPARLDAWAPDAAVLEAIQHTNPTELLSWLQGMAGIMQSAANHPDFKAKATELVANLCELDCAATMRLESNQWEIETITHRSSDPRGAAGSEPDWSPSQTMLEQVRAEKRTFRNLPLGANAAASLQNVSALVASPILDQSGEVIGAIYGDRRSKNSGEIGITALEALLIEIVACGVAAGLARLEQEKKAAEKRIQFEQFFSPALSRQLEKDRDLLKGKEVEVSLLFCDIRGSSRINERLGPVKTMEWISDVMGAFSECVINHDGVLVDYRGDEIVAMWGAPIPQSDHARRACAAALEIEAELPGINDRWQETLEEPVRIGIGINSGTAQAGNIGSHRKFQYGVLGKTIDLASRVQGATKHIMVDLLITDATAQLIDDAFPIRRLCSVRMVNMDVPVELYQLSQAGDDWTLLKTGYDEALVEFEKQNFRRAVRKLGDVLVRFPDDGPSTVLLSRVVNALAASTDDFDPCWTLPGK